MNELDKPNNTDLISEFKHTLEQKYEQKQDGTLESPFLDSNLNRAEAVESILEHDETCPQEIIERQEIVSVKYVSFDDKYHEGQIVVDKSLAVDVKDFFKLLLELKFPVQSVIPIVKFGWVDISSMEANNSSAFNFRLKEGNEETKHEISNHGYGFAIDINPKLNPVFKWVGEGVDRQEVKEPNNGKYNIENNGTFFADHPAVQFMKERGWTWGGDWTSLKDYHHFEKIINYNH